MLHRVERKQFRVLYRQFLFRMVDVELLAADARGDSGRLLGQFASLLIFLSMGLAVLGLAVGGSDWKAPAQLVATWTGEHFLIATTMLVVGLFAVLSWDSTFPDKQDVLVLGPLPIRMRTLFLAKISAVAVALGLTVAALHATAGLVWPFALNRAREAVAAPAITCDDAMPAVSAAGMGAVLDRDLGAPLRMGPLAAGTDGGAAIGVWKAGVGRVYAYGSARADSIFEIGSISKTFTGLLLARMTVEGRVRLDEPVRELLPAGTVARPGHFGEITLADLATHHSGLPGMPDNFDAHGKPNPLANYRDVDLYEYMGRRGVAKLKHERFDYSNLGGGLLGTALAERAGTTYGELLRREIAGPLGMADTGTTVPDSKETRVLPSYGAGHQRQLPWDLGALAGAGAIRSTAGDMVTYLAAQLHPELVADDGGMRAAIGLSHRLREDVEPGMRIGLFWMYDEASGTYWHNGQVAGYTSYAFFDPAHDCAVVVLYNMANAFGFTGALGEHVHARLLGRPAISLEQVEVPAAGGFRTLARTFAAYWLTMFAAGAFLFCSVLGVQGLLAELLPRQAFLRASSFLQLAAFGLFIAVYFLEPKLVTPGLVAAPQSQAYLAWSPTYWFLGLFQQLSGSPALAPLAMRAWIGLAVAVGATAGAYSLAYLRMMRKIVEAPDIASRRRGWMRLPGFGPAFDRAIGQFSARALLRSRQHRLMVAFYLGVGFAAAILFPRWPVMRELSEAGGTGWSAGVGLPALGATLLLMGLSVMGTRIAFALPVDLRSNWIFRVVPLPGGGECLRARRRAFYALSVTPVWVGSTALAFAMWPWQAAAEHSLLLAAAGAIFAEAALAGVQKIPFTCSYLPGKSNFHMTFLLCTGAVLSVIAKAVQLERATFEDAGAYAAVVAAMAGVAAGIAVWNWARVRSAEEGAVRFEETDAAVVTLNLRERGAMTD